MNHRHTPRARLDSLDGLVPLALEALRDSLSDAASPRERLAAARDVLDRVGMTKQQQQSTTGDMPARFIAMALMGMAQTFGGRVVNSEELEKNIEMAQLGGEFVYSGPPDELDGVDHRAHADAHLDGERSDLSRAFEGDAEAIAKLPEGLLRSLGAFDD